MFKNVLWLSLAGTISFALSMVATLSFWGPLLVVIIGMVMLLLSEPFGNSARDFGSWLVARGLLVIAGGAAFMDYGGHQGGIIVPVIVSVLAFAAIADDAGRKLRQISLDEMLSTAIALLLPIAAFMRIIYGPEIGMVRLTNGLCFILLAIFGAFWASKTAVARRISILV